MNHTEYLEEIKWVDDCCFMPKWALYRLYYDENSFLVNWIELEPMLTRLL